MFDATIEVPVTIRNPDKRIGTHVFTAMARNDAGLRWTAVTIDDADDAKNALDRITIPQDVLDRIAPTALPRSSIVVSDEPLSAETNYRTEFVAVLSNQPQGGFITRKPSTDALVASDNVRNDDRFGFFFQRNWSPQTGNARRWGGRTIVGAGSKTRQTARRPHGYSGPFAPDPTWCRGHPMSVLLPKGGMPRVAAECAIVRPIKFGDIVTASSSDHCSDKIEILPHGDCLLWVISGHLPCKRDVRFTPESGHRLRTRLSICWRRSGDYHSGVRTRHCSSIIGLLWRKPMRAFS